MELDIVLLPPKGLNRKIGGLLLEIKKQVALSVVVDGKKLLPHISLLHIQASSANIPNLLKALNGFSIKNKSFTVKPSKTSMAPGIFKAFFQLEVVKSKELIKLHKKIVKEISPLRQGKVFLPPKNPNRLQKEYLKKYGVGNILKYFRPHFTLGKIFNISDTKKVLKILSKENFTPFNANRLALTVVNKNHQVIKIIKEFRLSR